MDTGGKRSATAVEIVANIDAMETAVNEAATSERFAEEQLLRIHQRLMEHDPRPQIAGRFRIDQNWIGGNDYTPCGADFVPPPVEEVQRLLEDLYAVMNDDLLPPLVQAALVHAQFETIHPFDDGNGRTGRALIHVILRRRGVAPDYVPPISVILANSRERYIAGLTRFRGDGAVEWIEHFASATTHAANLAAQYVGKVESLMERWREQLRAAANPRADAAAWTVIDVLPAHPVITSPVAGAATGRSKGSIHDAIALLVEAGVLIPLSESQRNQSWEAVGLLDLLEELEAGGENYSMG
jgi:Fic family protein